MKLQTVILALFVVQVTGHGYLWEPSSRSALGSQENNICHVPEDYDHNGAFCGGRTKQILNKGKCGICGDAYDSNNKEYEVPGKYASGIITGSYKPGQVIDVLVDIVAYHKGFLAFFLCVNNNPNKDPTHDCFSTRLQLENGTDIFYVTKGLVRHHLRLKLPDGLECWQCILQWNYVTGNTAGVGKQNPDIFTDECVNSNDEIVGCGPQEMFRNCADICIGERCDTRRCQRAKPFYASQPVVHPTLPTTVTTHGTIIHHHTVPVVHHTTTEHAITTDDHHTTTEHAITTIDGHNQVQMLCKKSLIRKKFFSEIGQNYCQSTCFRKKLDYCNLFICTCELE